MLQNYGIVKPSNLSAGLIFLAALFLNFIFQPNGLNHALFVVLFTRKKNYGLRTQLRGKHNASYLWLFIQQLRLAAAFWRRAFCAILAGSAESVEPGQSFLVSMQHCWIIARAARLVVAQLLNRTVLQMKLGWMCLVLWNAASSLIMSELVVNWLAE